MTTQVSSVTTRDRVLDAALACVRDGGLSGLTLEDVATRAGVSRQTIYRYFRKRDFLIAAVIDREERVMLAQVRARTDAAPNLHEAIEDAFTALYEAARAHPLLDQLLASEPGAILPYVVGTSSVVEAARATVLDLLAQFCPEHDPGELQRVADITTRLCVSYVVAPSTSQSVPAVARSLAALVTAHLDPDREPADTLGARPHPG